MIHLIFNSRCVLSFRNRPLMLGLLVCGCLLLLVFAINQSTITLSSKSNILFPHIINKHRANNSWEIKSTFVNVSSLVPIKNWKPESEGSVIKDLLAPKTSRKQSKSIPQKEVVEGLNLVNDITNSPLNGTSNYNNKKLIRLTNLFDGEDLQPMNLYNGDSQPSYKSLYNLFVKQARINVAHQFKKIPPDIKFNPGQKIDLGEIRRVLIVSTWRSGSSFLGDLVKSYNGVFYSYEPLHLFAENEHMVNEGVEKSLKLLKDISVCNFTSNPDYITYLRNNVYVMKNNPNLWNSCFMNPAFCFDPNFMSDICQYMPLNVIKTVRLGLQPVESLLRDPYLNFKIIHLVRDPRGFLHSRMKMDWCSADPCRDPKTTCRDLLHDLRVSKTFSKKFPGRYHLVRYEDLTTDTDVNVRRLFSFLGLSFHDSIQKFLDTHTKVNSQNNNTVLDPYATVRDSHTIAFAWRASLSFEAVKDIQQQCKEPIRLLGYRIFENINQYRNLSLSIMRKLSN